MKKYYLISNHAMNKVTQCRGKDNVIKSLKASFDLSDYIYIHEDGRCIYHGLQKNYQ